MNFKPIYFWIAIIFISAIVAAISVMAGLIVESNTGNYDSGNTGSDIAIGYHGHVKAEKYDVSIGKWITVADTDNLLVDNGKEYIKAQIGGGASAATNSTKWISLSNNSTAPAAYLTNIPNEIVTNGFSRAAATYVDNGTGAWNYTYTWTSTGTQGIQMAALNYGDTANDNKMFAALAMNYASYALDDQLRVIWSISVSEP